MIFLPPTTIILATEIPPTPTETTTPTMSDPLPLTQEIPPSPSGTNATNGTDSNHENPSDRPANKKTPISEVEPSDKSDSDGDRLRDDANRNSSSDNDDTEDDDDRESSDDDGITPKMRKYVTKLVATVHEGPVAVKLIDPMEDMLADLVTTPPTTLTKIDKGKKKKPPKTVQQQYALGFVRSLPVVCVRRHD